jgi:hypothetical protein
VTGAHAGEMMAKKTEEYTAEMGNMPPAAKTKHVSAKEAKMPMRKGKEGRGGKHGKGGKCK